VEGSSDIDSGSNMASIDPYLSQQMLSLLDQYFSYSMQQSIQGRSGLIQFINFFEEPTQEKPFSKNSGC